MRAALRTPARRWAAFAVVVAIVIAVVAVWPRSGESPVAQRDVTITGAQAPWDSAPVQLDATLYLPATTPAPAVILAHGFGGTKRSVSTQAQDLARAGFVVLAYSARGFGNSTGQIALDSLDAEVPDARKVVDYLATLPEVVQDAAGDPRVGVTGGSYGGALSLMLAGTDPRVDTAVPVITWNNLEHALFPNYVESEPTTANTPADAGGGSDGVFKKYWAATMIASVVSGASLGASGQVDTGPAGGGVGRQSDEQSGSAAAPSSAGGSDTGTGTSTGGTAGAATDPGCGRLRLEICAAYANAAGSGRITPELKTLLENSSPSQVVGKITAPTLLVQGEQDTLFPLDQADANARAIAANGTPVAVDWYRGGHDGGSPDQATEDRITGWLVTHLRGGTMPANAVTGDGFRYSVDGGLTGSGRARTRVLQADSYPGLTSASSTPRQDIPLTGSAQIVLNPAGGIPAGISSLPGLGSQASLLSTFLGSGLPGQTATFTAAPADELRVVTGSSRVSVTVTALGSVTNGAGAVAGNDADSVLFASIGTRSSGGVSTLAGSAVSPLRLPALKAGQSATLTIDLPAAALQVAAGDELFVRFATTDQAYATPTSAAAYRISGVQSVSVPIAGGVRVSAGEVSTPALIGLIVLALVGIGGLVLVGRVRRRPDEVQHDAADTRAAGAVAAAADQDAHSATDAGEPVLPLEIRGLSKAYPGGVMAVEDVSFVVRPGRVVGLLGPNGAGKTTTLRMVMGLIQPTKGEILVFGRPVRSGAEILSRIGSFVEGSGFLPHLSGKVNLELYWKATGRPREDSHLDEILEIAGLGTAVHRRVKTYSQGMRQRLAIAQSMLGLPDLLILDEPTNGLDPPQIHAMREVLRGYAETGRTVLVSSHLLSEVEQTCQDVVVINHGTSIAAGRVVDLVASSGEMTFVVDDPDGAARLLREQEGIGDVHVDDSDRAESGTVVQVDLGELPAAQAISMLVSAGIAVTSAAPRNRLEDVFLDMVGATGPAAGGTS